MAERTHLFSFQQKEYREILEGNATCRLHRMTRKKTGSVRVGPVDIGKAITLPSNMSVYYIILVTLLDIKMTSCLFFINFSSYLLERWCLRCPTVGSDPQARPSSPPRGSATWKLQRPEVRFLKAPLAVLQVSWYSGLCRMSRIQL